MHKLLAPLVISAVLACGCTQSTDGRPDVTAQPVATFNAAGAPTVELSVPDMMCEESCAAKVREVLAAQPGAVDVKVDFPARTAYVAVEKSKFDVDAAIAALVDHGFDKTQVRSE